MKNMRTVTLSRCYGGTVILLACMIWSACAVMPKPDTCECSSCNLELVKDANPIELGLPGDTVSPSEQVIEVCACRPANKSGIKTKQGEEYQFQVVKTKEEWLDGDYKGTPQDGWQDTLPRLIGYVFSVLKRSSKTEWYALVGSIDGDDQESFAVFPRSVVMRKGGELYFYANDMEGRYFNNRGIIQLKVARIR